jgi:D-alanine--poly(phosphoribitol) ligase subunit 2
MEPDMNPTTSEQQQVQETIINYLSSKFLIDFDTVSDQTNLFRAGLIDSFGFIELVAFLEKTFGIKFVEKEFTSNSLNTLANIVATVKQKINS